MFSHNKLLHFFARMCHVAELMWGKISLYVPGHVYIDLRIHCICLDGSEKLGYGQGLKKSIISFAFIIRVEKCDALR